MYARDFRRYAREALAGRWGLALGVTLLASILGLSLLGSGVRFSVDLGDLHFDTDIFDSLYGLLYSPLGRVLRTMLTIGSTLSLAHLILGGPITVGYCRFALHLLDRQPATLDDLFSAFSMFGRTLWLHLQTLLRIVAWSLLFVVPGIVAAFRYAMAPYILAEHPELTASQAIAHSGAMMQGNKGRLFCLALSFLGWMILAALTCGIGSLWLNPYRAMAMTSFYRDVNAAYLRRAG